MKESLRTIDRNIVRIALPAIVSNITVPLLGLCDTAVTGHLGSAAFVAAIAVGAMMLNVILWSLGFLRMGTTGLTAQAFGRGDTPATRILFSRSLFLALSIGLLIILLHKPLGWLLIKLIGSDPDINALASSYFAICIYGAPGLLGSMAVSGWLLGMQNSVRPMAIAITTNVVNIAASIIFVFPLGMGFPGTALGTLTANWVSLAVALLLVRNFNRGKLPMAPVKEIFRLDGLGRFFKVNSDIFFRSFFIMAVSLGVTAIGARLGELTLAANAVIMQMFLLFSYFVDGLAFSAEALSGKAAGAREWNTLSRIVRRLLFWSGVVAAIFSLAYLCEYRLFTRLLVPEETVLSRIDDLRLWIWLLPFSSVLAFIFDGFFIGLTATRRMLIVTALSSGIFFLINFCLPASGIPEKASRLWLAFEIYLFIRGIALAASYPGIVRRLRKDTSA